MTNKLHRPAFLALSLLWAAVSSATLAQAGEVGGGLGDDASIPHIGDAGRQGYRTFAEAPLHRAFAIAPGGVWAWISGAATQDLAEAEALNACRQQTEQPCHLYAVDDQITLGADAWEASWPLGLSADDIEGATLGTARGQRFPDLSLAAPDGRAMSLSALQGKPVLVHFWGSWCPPCKTEFPELQKLYDALAGGDVQNAPVSFVLIQGRETIEKSRQWTEARGFTMPLYDSGHTGRGDKAFRMTNGAEVADRRLAPAYPSTYVLDANGLVVFGHGGAVEGWGQYESLLRHLAAEAR